MRLQEVQTDQEKESAELAETVAANPSEQSSENLLEVIRSVHPPPSLQPLPCPLSQHPAPSL